MRTPSSAALSSSSTRRSASSNLREPSREIHGRIAGSRFVLLKNSGHGTNMWRGDAFTDQTLAFLADVGAGRPVAGEVVVP